MTLSLITGDTAPTLTGTVSANLTGATTVTHIVRPDKTVLTKAATITDAATGAWSIDWVAGDLAQVGAHYVEVQVTFSNGKIQTFQRDASGQKVSFNIYEQYA